MNSEPKAARRTHPLLETASGLTAGIATTLVAHPLDLVKTRLQINRSAPSITGSSFRIARQIYRTEGGLQGFYRGISSNLIGNSVSWAFYFLWYDKVKTSLTTYHGMRRGLSYYDYFVASAIAGSLTAVCTNPIWVIKTRMLSTSASHAGAYTSVLDGIRRTLQKEGFLGFYRGLVPSILGVSHGAFQFMAYELMKKRHANLRLDSHVELASSDFLIFSGLSKMFAGAITYPYQVVRARLQTYDAHESYRGATDVVVQVFKQEGLVGFYKGLGPNLLRVVPSSCVTFLVYEKSKKHFPLLFPQMALASDADMQ